jgi:hypothetical protein
MSRTRAKQDIIIEYMKSIGKPLKTAEISDGTDIPRNQVSLLLHKLVKAEFVHKETLPGQGRPGLYSVYEDVVKRPYGYVRGSKVKDPVIPVGPDQFWKMLRSWANMPWEPAIHKSAKNLPQSVAELYRIAGELSYGDLVDSERLMEVLNNLNLFRIDLKAALDVVDRILATPEIRDISRLPQFLLNRRDVEEAVELSEQVLKLNVGVQS